MAQKTSVGTRIVEIREGLGISQAELARKLEISPGSLWRYEHDKVTPGHDMLVKLAGALSCSVADIADKPEAA